MPGGEPGIFLVFVYFLSQKQCLRPLNYCTLLYPIFVFHTFSLVNSPRNGNYLVAVNHKYSIPHQNGCAGNEALDLICSGVTVNSKATDWSEVRIC